MSTDGTSSQTSSLQGAGFWLALLVAGTFFMENLDATVITPAIPAMAQSFNVDPADLNIGVSAYMLTLGVFIPVSGWAAERFGARKVFSLAIVIFTIASLLCGLSQSLAQFVGMRILQGAGGALMVPVGRLVVLRVTPKHQLITAIAVLTWPALIAPVLGPPLGGFMVDHVHWGWIFWLNLPLGLIALACVPFVVPKSEGDGQRRFDWLGFILISGALLGLMLAVELVARTGIHAPAVASAVIGAGLLWLGVRHLNRTADPVFDLWAMSRPTFAVTIWGGSLFRMGINAIPFLIPLMFQIGFGYSAFDAGMMLMAVFAGNLVMKPATTPVLHRFGFRPVLVGNGIINAAAVAACAIFTTDLPLWVICVILFIGGMSRSMQFTALNTIAFADVPEEHMASANTLFSTVLQLGMGIGVALGAVGWRIGQLITPGDDMSPFRIAFLIVGVVSLLAVWDSWRLSPAAGDHVAKSKI